MSYLDRLRSLRYRSPSGRTFTAFFDDLSRSGSKKAAVSEFPQQDVPFVQDLGENAVEFSIALYFSGEDYDLTADDFWQALEEKGPGTLYHPRFGDVSVLPLTRSQSESFVDGLGRARFEIKFLRVGDASRFFSFPQSIVTAIATAIRRAASAVATVGEALEQLANPVDFGEILSARRFLQEAAGDVQLILAGAIRGDSQAASDFRSIFEDIDADPASFVDDPAAFFSSFSAGVQLAAQSAIRSVEKVRLFEQCFSALESLEPLSDTESAFFQSMLIAVFQGSAISATVGDVDSRDESAEAILTLQDLRGRFFARISALESDFPLAFFDPAAFATAKSVYADSLQALLSRAFSARVETLVTLAEYATPLNLVYRFYGSLDRLDEWEKQNKLVGDELFLLKPGREVRFFTG